MSEYIVELDSKHSIALKLAFVEEMRGGDFVREEIVRCRDCRYSVNDGEMCAEDCSDSWYWRCVEPNGFCSFGERKEGGE